VCVTYRYSVSKSKHNKFIVTMLLIKGDVSAYSEAIIRFNRRQYGETSEPRYQPHEYPYLRPRHTIAATNLIVPFSVYCHTNK